ncbi:DNA-binding transcriptional regulator MelR [Salmonella bongori]|nr:DNA-binding transcriptional regulator MelR [Salmonella bongori]
MAIFSLPMHLFLSWPLDRELINHVTHGMVVKSLATQQLSTLEVLRWQQETNSPNEQIRQLAIDEIGLMLKRFSLSGWQPILLNKTSRTHENSVSRHAQFYVSQMLGFIADNYDQALTINAVAEHVKTQCQLRDGDISARDAVDHEAVHHGNAHQSCTRLIERYRQNDP